MLALSMDTMPCERDRSENSGQTVTDEPPLTWRRWLAMLKPDTPAQDRTPGDGWRTSLPSE